jgi:hypothetical protein
MEGNYSSWLDKSQAEWHLRKKWLQNVENLERELDWVRQGAKGVKQKQKARLQNYDKMLNEDQKH